MVDSENKVPGITLWLKAHREEGQMDSRTKIITCELYGQYEDSELWEKIKRKLSDGFRIYSEEDFQGEVLAVMRQDYQKEMEDHAQTKHTLTLEVARRLQAEQELAKLKGLLGSLGAGLGKR